MSKSAPQKIKTDITAEGITKRARIVVEKITSKGVDHHDIARFCGTTVLSLLDGGKPSLTKAQIKSLALHYNVSILWLLNGLGPQFINPN